MQKSIFAQTLFDKSMESRLIVRNFGPIKDVDVTLKNVNVFIGPQASGKSALAKLYTIFKAPRKFFYSGDDKDVIIDSETASKQFKDVLSQYNIDSFLKADTEIIFESALHTIGYNEGKLQYNRKLFDELSVLETLVKNFQRNQSKIRETFTDLARKFISFDLDASRALGRDNDLSYPFTKKFIKLTNENCLEVFNIIKAIEKNLSTNTSLYIPAERNFINIIKKSALNLILNKVPIPQHILSFGAELEKLSIDEISLDFLQKGLKYKIVNGEDKIFIDEWQSISLTEAASGVQSVVPILAPILNRRDIHHRSFVIEEPELNLFPLAQYELIQFLESNRPEYEHWDDVGTIHTYTTHSPYILSAINNLLYARKVKNWLFGKHISLINEDLGKGEQAVNEIVKATINPFYFTAYQISNGFARSIFNRETGLIESNYIDAASDKINEDFEALMELTK